MKFMSLLSAVQKLSLLPVLGGLFLSGCQFIKVQENQLNNALSNKTNSILTQGQLSETTRDLLNVIQQSPNSCLANVEPCIEQLNSNTIFEAEERYAAISEIYLAKAFEIEQQCKLTPSIQKSHPSLSQKNYCQDQQLSWLDKSLRYSYVYLFKTPQSPESRIFDQRQMQVRTFYNVGLSRLMTSSFLRYQYPQIPQHMSIGASQYQFDLNHYPELKNRNIEKLVSSYILKFTGFYSINRQEGLGSEFVVVTEDASHFNNNFILDPEQYFKDKTNPNIHRARYLSVSATAEASDSQVSAEEILSGKMNFTIKLFNPYQYKTTQIQGKAYTLTANYSVPFAMWLAENKLGSTGYRSLMNRTDSLRMPHLYLIEPYQPQKKVIVLIHGLASSPETWVSLTNNILGDKRLRDQFQIWQIFYSTNMPILESRFQINALLKQAFAQTEPNSVSAHNAVIIGHSMGGIISRLLVSDVDVSKAAIPLMNYEQYIQYQQHPIIQERFIFKPELPLLELFLLLRHIAGLTTPTAGIPSSLKSLLSCPMPFLSKWIFHSKILKARWD